MQAGNGVMVYCLPCKIEDVEDNFDDMEYSDDECTSISSLEESSSYSLMPVKTLMIDELESVSSNKTNTTNSPRKRGATRLNTEKDSLPCPCCSSYVHCRSTKKNNLIASNVDKINQQQQSPLSTLIESVWSEQNSNVRKEGEKEVKFEYEVVKCIMENWLRKKGSGKDLIGNKSWKSRWCKLVLAKIPGEDEEVPLFLAGWHFTMPAPSTIIRLDTKVAVSVDDSLEDSVSSGKPAPGKQTNRFDIVDSSKSSMRTFAAPSPEERDSWVQAINAAVCQYDRAQRSSRMLHSPRPPVIPRPIRITRSASNLEGVNLVC